MNKLYVIKHVLVSTMLYKSTNAQFILNIDIIKQRTFFIYTSGYIWIGDYLIL